MFKKRFKIFFSFYELHEKLVSQNNFEMNIECSKVQTIKLINANIMIK